MVGLLISNAYLCHRFGMAVNRYIRQLGFRGNERWTLNVKRFWRSELRVVQALGAHLLGGGTKQNHSKVALRPDA